MTSPPVPNRSPSSSTTADAGAAHGAPRAPTTDLRDRLVVELLARTGLRVGELCDLDSRRRGAVSVTATGCGSRSASSATTATSRCIPDLVELLADWTARNLDHIRRHGPPRRRPTRPPSTVTSVDRIVRRVARHAGVDHVHPHQLRHTLATQAINRGMRLEAIAALLGHRSMEMTLTYARIADRVVADEYAAVTTQIDALYNAAEPRARSRRDRDRGDDPPPTRSPRPHARQRPLHPARRTRLPHGISLRDLRLLRTPDPSSFPSSSANATTPATTTNPTESHSSNSYSPRSNTMVLDTITRITPVRGGQKRRVSPLLCAARGAAAGRPVCLVDLPLGHGR